MWIVIATAIFSFFFPAPWQSKVISANVNAGKFPPFDAQINHHGHEINPLLTDQTQQFFQYKTHLVAQISQGVWPTWLPHILCGNSFAGNIQSQAFYPFTYLGLFMPVSRAETFARLIECLIATVGMMLFLRSVAGLAWSVSLVGGLAFCFCAYRIVWLNHPHASSLTYLPWLLWSLGRLTQPPYGNARHFFGTAIGVYLTIAGGHPQTFILVLGGTTLFAAWNYLGSRTTTPRTEGWRPPLRVFGGLALGVLLASVILLPFADALFHDSFTYGDRAGIGQRGIVPARAFWVAVFPDWFGSPLTGNDRNLYNYNENALFVGATTLWLAVVGLPFVHRNRIHLFFFSLLAVVVATLCGVPLISDTIRSLPILRDMPIMRTSLWLQVATVACACFALHRLAYEEDATRPQWRVACILAVASAWILFVIAGSRWHPEPSAFKPAWISCAAAIALSIAVFLARGGGRKWIPWLALLAVYAEVHLAHSRYNPIIPVEVAELPAPPMVARLAEASSNEWFRVAGIDGTLEPNLGVMYGIRDIRGYDLPMKRRYVEFLSHAFYKGEWRYGMIYWHAGGLDFLKPENLHLARLMGIRQVLFEGKAIDLAEKIHPLPHVYLATNVQTSTGTIATDVEVLRQGDPWVVEFPGELLPAGDPQGSIQSLRSHVNGATMTTRLASPTVIALNEMPIRGWKAKIDGERSPVFPVNVIHTGTVVPAGEHHVSFYFLPDSLILGASISGTLFVLLVIGGCTPWIRRRCATTPRPTVR